MKQYMEKGWAVFDFPLIDPLLEVREILEKELSRLLGTRTTLERYRMEDDQRHSDIQIAMTRFFRDKQFDFTTPLLPQFREILGPDIVRQENPFLRIARPEKQQDNIGFHKDSFYGGTAYELSFFVPFVDLGPGNTMSVISGSHIEAETAYPTTQFVSQEVTKGSPKHQLGFMYAPKVMEPSIAERVEPVPLKLGQALVFCLPIVHGCVVNKEKITRWSTDQRLMSRYAPVEMGTRQVVYKVISQSPASYCVEKYEEANGKRSEIELGLCVSKN